MSKKGFVFTVEDEDSDLLEEDEFSQVVAPADGAHPNSNGKDVKLMRERPSQSLKTSLARLAAFEYEPLPKRSKESSEEMPSVVLPEPVRDCSLQPSQRLRPRNSPQERKPVTVCLPSLSVDQTEASSKPKTKRGSFVNGKKSSQISEFESDSDFDGNSWLLMNRQLGLLKDADSPLLDYNIANTLKEASLEQLPESKTAHLRVFIKSLTQTGSSTSALFKDPSGEISGSIHRKLFEQHGSALGAGAVLILKQVTVFSPSARQHYLNITPANVVRFYPSNASLGTLSVDDRLLEDVLNSLKVLYPVGKALMTQLLEGLDSLEDDFSVANSDDT